LPVPSEPGDVLFFDSYAPHASKPNRTQADRRILYITITRADGDHRTRYFAEKRATIFPRCRAQAGGRVQVQGLSLSPPASAPP